MSRTREERQVLLFCLLTDLLIFWLSLNVATLTRLHTLMYYNLWLLQRDRLVCVLLFAVSAVVGGCYDRSRLTDRFDSVYFVWVSLVATGISELALATLLPEEIRVISRRELVLGLMIAAILLAVWRYCVSGLISRFKLFHHFFYVLGDEEVAERVAKEIRRSLGPLAEARFVTLEELTEKANGGEETPEADECAMADAVITLTTEDHDRLIGMLDFCVEHCRRTLLYPSLYDTLFFQHSSLLAVGGIPLIEAGSRLASRPYHYVKRAIDFSASALSLLLALPICVVTALAVKLTSRGGVFYTQERLGKDGRIFKLYKFRSMVADAEAQTGPVWAEASDMRVTAVGRFIRKRRIDEIPQLFNVLKGDMSIIGPRPERAHFHEEFCRQWPLFDKRLAVRPGLTSLSHVLGSYDSDPQDRLRYDLIYISGLSFVLDLKIMVATVRVVLGAKGAR